MSIKSFVSILFGKIIERAKWGKGVFKRVNNADIKLPQTDGDKEAWREFNTSVTPLHGEPAVNPHNPEDQPKDSPCGGEVVNGPIARHDIPGEKPLYQAEIPLPAKEGPAAYPPGELSEEDDNGNVNVKIKDASAKEK